MLARYAGRRLCRGHNRGRIGVSALHQRVVRNRSVVLSDATIDLLRVHGARGPNGC